MAIGLLAVAAAAVGAATVLDRARLRAAQVIALDAAAAVPLSASLAAALVAGSGLATLLAAVATLVAMTAATHVRSLPARSAPV